MGLGFFVKFNQSCSGAHFSSKETAASDRLNENEQAKPNTIQDRPDRKRDVFRSAGQQRQSKTGESFGPRTQPYYGQKTTRGFSRESGVGNRYVYGRSGLLQASWERSDRRFEGGRPRLRNRQEIRKPIMGRWPASPAETFVCCSRISAWLKDPPPQSTARSLSE